ncbi:hypothetical protein BDN71DRAFT_1501119 [Pleurotus eryngii]|uniref:Uncharacterized protein n=1 Tax=Pleurotus eryngii TaxID=5323 RepID=A0A9P6DJS9_PLEER|nr:hypothetical protein BDN71DRAFT_1501119 [Pleurotus eryngii]
MYRNLWDYPYRFHAGPSRFVWFSFGAIAATIWAKRMECYPQGRSYGHCYRVPPHYLPPPTPPPTPRTPETTEEPSLWSADASNVSSVIKGLPQAINNIPPADDSRLPRSFGERVQQEKWEEEKERMLELGRQVGDSMAEISEATLDSVMSAIEALKNKVTMHRIQREEQRKKLEKEVEQEKSKPFRWV